MKKNTFTILNFNCICKEHLVDPYIVKEDLQANRIDLNNLTKDKLTEFILNNY